jgi:hypothetical protein
MAKSQRKNVIRTKEILVPTENDFLNFMNKRDLRGKNSEEIASMFMGEQKERNKKGTCDPLNHKGRMAPYIQRKYDYFINSKDVVGMTQKLFSLELKEPSPKFGSMRKAYALAVMDTAGLEVLMDNAPWKLIEMFKNKEEVHYKLNICFAGDIQVELKSLYIGNLSIIVPNGSFYHNKYSAITKEVFGKLSEYLHKCAQIPDRLINQLDQADSLMNLASSAINNVFSGFTKGIDITTKILPLVMCFVQLYLNNFDLAKTWPSVVTFVSLILREIPGILENTLFDYFKKFFSFLVRMRQIDEEKELVVINNETLGETLEDVYEAIAGFVVSIYSFLTGNVKMFDQVRKCATWLKSWSEILTHGKKLYDWVYGAILGVLNWIHLQIYNKPLPMVETKLRFKIDEMHARIERYMSIELKSAAVTNTSLQKEMEDTIKNMWLLHMEVHAKGRQDMKVVVNEMLRVCLHLNTYLLSVCEKHPPQRYEPVCFMLHGNAGVGKTKILEYINRELLRRYLNAPGTKDGPGGLGSYYSELTYYMKMSSLVDPYKTGYVKQIILIMDDFGQQRDTLNGPSMEYFDLIHMKGSSPMCLPAAFLETKGKIYMNSPFIALTSNIWNHVASSLSHPEALQRRIEIRVHCELADEDFITVVDGKKYYNHKSSDDKCPWKFRWASGTNPIDHLSAKEINISDLIDMIWDRHVHYKSVYERSKSKDNPSWVSPKAGKGPSDIHDDIFQIHGPNKIKGETLEEKTASIVDGKQYSLSDIDSLKVPAYTNLVQGLLSSQVWRVTTFWGSTIKEGRFEKEMVMRILEARETDVVKALNMFIDAKRIPNCEYAMVVGESELLSDLVGLITILNGEYMYNDIVLGTVHIQKEALRSPEKEYKRNMIPEKFAKEIPYFRNACLPFVSPDDYVCPEGRCFIGVRWEDLYAQYNLYHKSITNQRTKDKNNKNEISSPFIIKDRLVPDEMSGVILKQYGIDTSFLEKDMSNWDEYDYHLSWNAAIMYAAIFDKVKVMRYKGEYDLVDEGHLTRFSFMRNENAPRWIPVQAVEAYEKMRATFVIMTKENRATSVMNIASWILTGLLGITGIALNMYVFYIIAKTYSNSVSKENNDPYEQQINQKANHSKPVMLRAPPILREAGETPMKNTDTRYNDFQRVLLDNTYSLVFVRNDVRYHFCNAIAICGKTFLTVSHDLSKYMDSQEMLLMRKGQIACRTTNINNSMFVQLTNYKGEPVDAVLFNMPSRDHTKIIHHFKKEDDLKYLQMAHCALLVNTSQMTPGYGPSMFEIETKGKFNNFSVEVAPNSFIRVNTGVTYKAESRKGDCGSPLVDKCAEAARRMIAIHNGSTNDGLCYGSIVTQEMLLNALRLFEKKDQRELDVEHLGIKKEPVVIKQESGVNVLYDIQPIEGNIDCAGRLIRAPSRAPAGTKIRKSPFHGVIKRKGVRLEPIRFPANLFPRLDYMPLEASYKKITNDAPYLDYTKMKRALDVVESMMLRVPMKTNRFLTVWESYHGIEGSKYIQPMNRRSACGYPSELKLPNHRRGKTFFLGEGEDKVLPDELIVNQLLYEHKFRNFINHAFVFKASLKDELRPEEKITKPRLFCAGDMEFTALCRKYCIPFCEHVMENRINNFIAVGIDPHSEWGLLNRFLAQNGMQAFDGDIGQFDGSISRELVMEICEMIIRIYKSNGFIMMDNEYEIIRGIFEQIASAQVTYKEFLMLWNHAEPSGNPLTAVINSIITIVYMLMAWQTVFEDTSFASPFTALKYIAMIVYGDDHVVAVQDLARDFNQQSVQKALASMGITYTSAQKTNEFYELKPLSQTIFLKRHMGDINNSHGPLDIDIIYDMLLWSKKGEAQLDVFCQTIESALIEICAYGKLAFDDLAWEIRSALYQTGIDYIVKNYSYYMNRRLEILW